MSYQIKPGSIAGRLGKGIGQALSEQIPKEVDRYRLSSGLERLGRQDFTGKSPLEQLGAIHGIPGMTPELAAQAQQQIQNRQFFGASPFASQQPQSVQQQAQQNVSQNAPGNVKNLEEVPALSERSSNYGIPLSATEIEDKAREEYRANPQRFRSYQDYVDYAQKQDDKRVDKEHAFEDRQLKAAEHFNAGLPEILQKQGQGVYKDLPGDIARMMKNKLKNRVDQGQSAAQAADTTLQEVLPLVRARNDIAQATGFFDRIGKKPEDVRSRLDNARDIYKKANALRVFRDDLVSEGMDDAYANYLAYPVKDNKEVNNIISSLPKVKPAYFTSATSEGKEMGKSKKEKNEAQLAQEIGPKLKDGSILSIALALKGRGYDGTEFVRQMKELDNTGQIELNDRQKDELTKDFRLKPNLMDLYLFSRIGLDPIMEVK